MALAIANQWTAAANFSDVQVITTPTPGNWLIACVGWRMGDGTMPPLNLGDLSRNLWTLLATPVTLAYSSHGSALTQVEVWACPAATFEGWDSLRVFASTNISALDTGSLMLNVAEVSGMVNGFLTVDSVTVDAATAASAFSLVAPSPSGGANCLVLGAAFVDSSTATITATGVGFTGLTQISETTPNAKLAPQWRTATASVTAAWTSSAPVNWCGVAVAIRETGVSIAQPSVNWPIVRYQVGFGYDMTTPLSAVQWTDQTSRFVDTNGSTVFAATRGIPYELGQVNSEPADLMIRNDDGAYTPRPVATGAEANANGTATTIKIADANATDIHVSDFFRLRPGIIDLFGRTVASGVGTADSGYVYTTNGGAAADYAVGSGYASVTHPTTGVARAFTLTSPAADVDIVIDVATDVLAAGASLFGGPVARWISNSDWYMARLEFTVAQTVILTIRKRVGGVETVLATSTATPLTHVAATFYRVRLSVLGGNLAAKAWLAAGTEPDDWQATASDYDLVAASSLGTRSFSNAGNTNVNPVIRFDNLGVSSLTLKEITVFQVASLSSAAGTTTVTFARADGVAGGAQATTALGDVYAGIPIDTHIPWRKIDYWGGKWYPAAIGWFGSLPQTWRNPSWGHVPAVGIDPLATLTAGNPTAARGEILRRNPTHYWPLSDPGGGNSDSDLLGTAQDASGNGQRPLQQVISKYGRGANNVADFGAATQDLDTALIPPTPTSLLGDSGTGWQQSGLTSAEMPTKGYALVGQSDSFPPIGNGVTIMGASVVPLSADLAAIQAAAFNGTMMIIRNTDPALAIGQGAIVKLSIDTATTRPSISVWDKDTHARTDVTPGAGAGLVQRFWSAWFLTFNRTSWALYLGGNTPAASGSCDLVATFGEIDIGGEADEFFHGRFWPGIHAHIAVFDRRLTGEECFNLYTAVVSGTVAQNIAAEVTSDRVSRKLDSVGWTGPRIVTPSDNQIANEGDDSGSVTELLNDIADYEDGLLFVDAAGQLQWRGHLAGYFQTVRQVLGEDTAGGEIPFQPGQEMPYDLTYLYNKVEISNTKTRLFSRVTTLFPAADPPPYPKGLRTLTRDTRLWSAGDAFGLSWWLLSRYRKAQLRVTSVEIDCASYPAAWTFCLGAEVGDLITVKKRPLNAPAISLDCRIIQIKRNEGPNVARFTFALATAAPPVLVLGDSAKSVLGDATIGF